eukprot:scaffold6012_cov106-Isochrysis_galbana.AAC.3
MQLQRVGRGASLFDSSAPPCAGASEQDRTSTLHLALATHTHTRPRRHLPPRIDAARRLQPLHT